MSSRKIPLSKCGVGSLALLLALAATWVLAASAGAIVVTEFPPVTGMSSPAGIAGGADGNLWVTDRFGDAIDRVNTQGELTDRLSLRAAGAGTVRDR